MRFVAKLLHFGDGADEQCTVSQQVIAGLDPAIHEAAQQTWNSIGFIWGTSLMDARVKPAHDAECVATPDKTAALFCAAALLRLPYARNYRS